MKANRINKQKGVASIEFGLGFMAFFLMCMLWAEIGYIAYVSSVNDLAIAEAAREAKKINPNATSKSAQTSFMQTFKAVIREQSGLMGGVINPDDYRLTVHYYATLDELAAHSGEISDQCTQDDAQTETECGEPNNSSLAIYQIRYDYEPMLSFFMDGSNTFTREVIVIQEYERDQFKI
ncbi:pilus assembly protein [Vibrio brasiliensis]|jgi:tight adherence protein E|uniref:TadE/TadG family type IV pilus assembly protein n=1 Tax=Vibrio brasiliensis TaxID=170652 RepID=UPI001EFC8007|nr:TadE family protein [Vibrio brasiliensis]MCG9748881.1 pilus assembly protein [Vibrio brasiliensis]MCG9782164.1 pilus assembly protein [Vibrio brasiliensis]